MSVCGFPVSAFPVSADPLLLNPLLEQYIDPAGIPPASAFGNPTVERIDSNMSALAKIHGYYITNSDLQAAVPYDRLYTRTLPRTVKTYPYASLIPVSDTIKWLTNESGINDFVFQINVYSTSLLHVEEVLDIFEEQFNWQDISSDCSYVRREDRMPAELQADQPSSGVPVYSGWVSWTFGFTIQQGQVGFRVAMMESLKATKPKKKVTRKVKK